MPPTLQTGADEATLCKEAGLPYVSICMVDNFGNGIAQDQLSYASFKAGVHQNQTTMEHVASLVIENID